MSKFMKFALIDRPALVLYQIEVPEDQFPDVEVYHGPKNGDLVFRIGEFWVAGTKPEGAEHNWKLYGNVDDAVNWLGAEVYGNA